MATTGTMRVVLRRNAVNQSPQETPERAWLPKHPPVGAHGQRGAVCRCAVRALGGFGGRADSMSLGEQATAAPAAGSTDRRHQQCCRRASLTPSAHEQAASCHESTEHLRSERTRGSGAGAHRGPVTACLEQRRSHARSWRKPSIQVSIPPVASIPQPSEHICCENSAVRRSFDTGSSTSHAEGRGRQESVGTASLILRRGGAKCSFIY